MGNSSTAVLVVHGVGDTGPGVTLDALIPALANSIAPTSPGLTRPSIPEVYWLKDLSDEEALAHALSPKASCGNHKKSLIELFPAHFRGTTVQGREVVFAEVYWADLSRIREGVLHLFLGVFYTIFGLRHIADQAAAQRTWICDCVRYSVFFASFLLRGPIVALNIFLVATVVLGYLALKSSAFEYVGSDVGLLVMGILSSATVAGGLVAGKISAPLWKPVSWSLALVGASALSLVVFQLVAAECASFRAFDRFVQRQFVSWNEPVVAASTVGLMASADGPLLAAATLHAQQNSVGKPGEPRWYVGILLYVIYLGFDLLCVIMLVPTVIWFSLQVRLLAGWGKTHGESAIGAVCVAGIAQIGLWSLITSLLTYAASTIDGIRLQFPQDQADQFLAIDLLVMAALVATVIGTWCLRKWRPRTRLLVGVLIQVVLFVAFLIVTVLNLYVDMADNPRNVLQGYSRPIIVVAGFLISITAILSYERLRDLLHIGMDVINHFYRPYEPIKFLGRKTPLRFFTIRQQIAHRIKRVLETLLESEEPTHLVIVAHSQGSIIALDALNSRDWKAGRNLKISLITMGSPLTHLYQHYFPQQYPSFCLTNAGHWAKLLGNLDNWTNVYRRDDFVGTFVDSPSHVPDNNSLLSGILQNTMIADGGHTDYWRQPEFLLVVSDVFNKVI